jgi:hypothetical protein
MPKTDSDLRDDPSVQEDSQGSPRTRIDRAHVVDNAAARDAGGEPEVEKGDAAPAGGETPRGAPSADDSEAAAEQLRNQAEQLAAYLRSRQRDLDQRESRLNARMAQVDASARNTRMTLNQQQAELAERESALAETWESRRRQLEQSETLLAETRAETEHLREQLLLDRQKVQQEAKARAEQAAAEHRRVAMELEKKRDALGRRSEEVDRSRLAMLKLRSELGKMHRETLEIRMATEELWIQLSGTAPPIALSRSLERIRAQLAEQYRTAATELAEQKRELHAIREELSRQHDRLIERKRDLEGWARRREEEIQHQTSRLDAREEELEHRQTALDDLARQWQSEQLDYRTEIRQLRARLDESACTAITA